MYYIKKYKYLLLLIPVAIFLIFYLNPKEEEEIDIFEPIEVEKQEKEEIEKIETIKIDIKGAVNNPGVYEVAVGSRLIDAVNISGGLTKEADTSTINLSKVLKDEMVIIIYTKKEIETITKGTTVVKYIEKECVCPKLENDACITDKITNIDKETSTGKISLNTATLKELTTLNGIGEAKAKLIIEYREKNGGFKTIEEVKNIKGIGETIYEKIKDDITV